MGLPFAPIMTGFPGAAEPGASDGAPSPRTRTAAPSPFGNVPDAESEGTHTIAIPQNEFGSDAPSQYQLSDAAILSLQLRAMQGKAGASDETPTNAAPQAKQSTDGPQRATPGSHRSTDRTERAAPQRNPSSDGPPDLASQESNLESALESMGISPGAMQEFMYVSQVLAQAAPGLFQDFVAQVVNLADLYKQAQSPIASNPGAPGGNAKPQTGLQIVSIEESQASVSVTQSASGESLSVSAQEEALTFVSLGSAPAQGQPTPPAKSGAATSPQSSAPKVTPTAISGPSASAA